MPSNKFLFYDLVVMKCLILHIKKNKNNEAFVQYYMDRVIDKRLTTAK